MMTQKWVIFHCGIYDGGSGYSGTHCQKAGIRPGRIYNYEHEAEADCIKLNKVLNEVLGNNCPMFEVTSYYPERGIIKE